MYISIMHNTKLNNAKRSRVLFYRLLWHVLMCLWKEDWGQTHEEICSDLGYDEEDSDDLLMDDYFWDQEDEKWYNKHSSTMTEEEEKIADFLRNNS